MRANLGYVRSENGRSSGGAATSRVALALACEHALRYPERGASSHRSQPVATREREVSAGVRASPPATKVNSMSNASQASQGQPVSSSAVRGAADQQMRQAVARGQKNLQDNRTQPEQATKDDQSIEDATEKEAASE